LRPDDVIVAVCAEVSLATEKTKGITVTTIQGIVLSSFVLDRGKCTACFIDIFLSRREHRNKARWKHPNTGTSILVERRTCGKRIEQETP
jgi:hypothetical protein